VVKISIIMVDGGFRENTLGAKYFSQQDFPEDQYEVIWVDYFDKINPEVTSISKVNAISLNKSGIYHSSCCFNRGIKEAQGEIIVIPDADQIVTPDFLSQVWEIHKHYEKLVVYGYRYDEVRSGILTSYDFKEIEEKCVFINPLNYGGCLTVRKKWLLEMNGYEEHEIFRSGFHANGLLMYTRFKNMGLAIQWEPTLKLYHPKHPFTLSNSLEYKSQFKVINWIQASMFWKAIKGLDPTKNEPPPAGLKKILDEELAILNNAITKQWNINSIAELSENTTQPLIYNGDNSEKKGYFSKIKRKLFRSAK
jgi:hypothetical protein